MRLTVLGSASGISMPGRGHASVALESGDGLYLFDLGEPVGRELLARKLPVDRVRAAFVSHMHADHVGGLFAFIKNLHLYHNHPDYLPQVDEITLALPEEAVKAVQDFLVATYSFPERMGVRVDYFPLQAGALWEDGNIRVKAHPSSHLEGMRGFLAGHPEYAGPKCQAFFFEVKAEGKRVIYSGDLGSVEDILPAAKGADLLVLEFGHLLPLEENLKRLEGLGIGSIVLTHIFPDFTDKTDLLQATADSVLPGVVVVAEDGLVATV